MKKRVFYSELAYVVGLIVMPMGAALMTMADFGLSMVIAPAYILHLKLSESFDFFSFGMAEYTFQALLLAVTALVLRRFKISYLLSFVTAFLYGLLLDTYLSLLSYINFEPMYMRLAAYVLGMLITAVGVAMFFKTYISPEVYELLVKEASDKFDIPLSRFKTAYDCASLCLSVILTFSFFGMWEFCGIGWGTLLCALVNGKLIGMASSLFDKRYEFTDRLKWRRFFV